MHIAIYYPLGHDNDEEALAFCKNLGISPQKVDRYHPSSNAIGALSDQRGYYSWCKSLPNKYYDAIVFLPGCKIYANAWSKALLSHCFAALRSLSGMLVVPFSNSQSGAHSGFVQLAHLSEFIGTPKRVVGEMAFFLARQNDLQAPPNILSWFLVNWGRSCFYFSEFQALESSGGEAVKNFFSENVNLRTNVTFSVGGGLVADFLSREQESLAKFLVYSVYGVNAKSHVFSRVLREVVRCAHPSWADIGGGSGLLGLQMLLDTPSIASVTNFEKSPAQAMIGADASTLFAPEVSSRYLTHICRVDDPDFLFRGAFDVMTLLTTLCYIPRAYQRAFLNKAWAALAPGGSLIILENIKSNAYSRDYDLMFTDDELNELLVGFGDIEYRSAVTGAEVDGQAMRGKTCYRVLHKG